MSEFFTATAEDRAGERGAGMAEYALLLLLIAVALVGGFGLLANGISAGLDTVIAAF